MEPILKFHLIGDACKEKKVKSTKSSSLVSIVHFITTNLKTAQNYHQTYANST